MLRTHSSRRELLKSVGLSLGVVALGDMLEACSTPPSTSAAASSQAAAAPAGAPSAASAVASAADATEEATPQATTTSIAGGATSWQTVVDGAKREGTVVVYGPAGDAVHAAMTQGFQNKYGINVDFTGAAGPDVVTRILSERAAGQYNSDVQIAGLQTLLHNLKPANALTPLTPLLNGPDDSDPSVWHGGSFIFADTEGDLDMVFAWQVQSPFVYNTTLVSPGEVTTWRDLLNPKWKGQIAMLDPTHGGAAQEVMMFLYATNSLGKQFLNDLFAQDIYILTDSRQLLDVVGQGEKSLAIGPADVQAYALMQQGVPLNLFGGEDLKEGSFLTAGSGSFSAFSKPAHPNAQKLYIDWLLSPEGQLAFSKASGLASARTGVATDFLVPQIVPLDGVNYLAVYKEQYQDISDEVVAYVKTLMPA